MCIWAAALGILVGPDRTFADEKLAPMVVDGYLDNYEKCSFRCKFIRGEGFAESIAAAKQGKITNVRKTVQFEWVKSEKREKYRVICPKLDPGFVTKDSCVNFYGITDGKYALRHTPDLRFTNFSMVDEDIDFLYAGEGTPFCGACPLYFSNSLLKAVTSGAMTMKQVKREDGLLGLLITDKDKKRGDGDQVDVVVDPARGFLPIEMTFSRNGKITHADFADELIQTSSGAWMPQRLVGIHLNDPSTITFVRVAEIQFGPIDRSEFTISLPKGMVASHISQPAVWTYYKRDRLDPDGLPELYDRCQKEAVVRLAKEKQARDMGFLDDQPAARKSMVALWFAVGTALVMAAIGSGYFWRRRWRAARIAAT